MPRTAIVWFRRDLRLGDNEALTEALSSAATVVPVFVLPDGEGAANWSGRGSATWLQHSLAALDGSLRQIGSRLVIRNGPITKALVDLARECKAASVHCTREWSPEGLAHEQRVGRALREAHIALEVSEGSLLVQPDAIAPESGGDKYRVFAPFFSAWERQWGDLSPKPAPTQMSAPRRWPASGQLPPAASSDVDLRKWWTPGEAGARERLDEFIETGIRAYPQRRDHPDVDGTSRLSPHLAFGEISPRQVVAAVTAAAIERDVERTFLRQIAWREFSAHVVHCNPSMVTLPLRREFEAMPWHDDPESLNAWRHGMTGYPLVDAGMRQLAKTGWLHNRVRMVAASLLTKHLLIHWRDGLTHFADLLTDHEVPSNVFNWQWVAGCGADAAPYFRIFSPTLQAARYDADGTYIREWVPELEGVPSRWITRPWEMPAEEARKAGLQIGETYPAPIVNHTEAHHRALAVYGSVKGA